VNVCIFSSIVPNIILVIVLNMLFSGLIILLELSDNLLFSLLEYMLLLGDLCSNRGLLLNWRLA